MATKSGIDLVAADPRLNSISVDKMPPSNNLRSNNRMLLRHLSLIRDSLEPLLPKYDYILLDSHPDLYDLEKSIIYASDYCVSPIKLDNQSAIGVPSTVEAIHNVDEDIQALAPLMEENARYENTVFLGAMGMMCREWGGMLKYSEQAVYNRLQRTTGVFKSYVTEGDGLRQAAAQNCSVYDITTQNGTKQSGQFKEFINELLTKI